MSLCLLILLLGYFNIISNSSARDLHHRVKLSDTEYKTGVIFLKDEFKRQKSDPTKTSYSCYPDIGCFYANGTFKHLNALPDPPEVIRTSFALYTRRNPNTPVYMNYLDYNTVFTDKFNIDEELKIICHGFAMDGKNSYLIDMKNTLLKKDDYNVMIIDWSRGALPPFYYSAAVDTELVGRQVARLIYLLVKHRKASEKSVHIIGFSLGAHLSGFAGKWLRKEYKLTIDRISALDPASFLFEENGADVHVSKEDAEFVDVIHTSSGTNILSGELGMTKAVGHADFYPNGGKKQPGCIGLICNHMRALELFTTSIESECEYRAVHCENFDIFDDGGCFLSNSEVGQMGYYSKFYEGRGILYLATSSLAPYCGSSVLVVMTVSEKQATTYCGISITLVGETGVMEHINVTDSNSQKVQPREILKKHAVINTFVQSLTAVHIQYRTYKGWLYTGTPSVILKNLVVKDDKSHIWFEHATHDVEVSSSSELVLKA